MRQTFLDVYEQVWPVERLQVLLEEEQSRGVLPGLWTMVLHGVLPARPNIREVLALLPFSSREQIAIAQAQAQPNEWNSAVVHERADCHRADPRPLAPWWKVTCQTAETDILAIELNENRMVGILQSYYVCRGILEDGRPCLTVAPSGEWLYWETELESEMNDDVRIWNCPRCNEEFKPRWGQVLTVTRVDPADGLPVRRYMWARHMSWTFQEVEDFHDDVSREFPRNSNGHPVITADTCEELARRELLLKAEEDATVGFDASWEDAVPFRRIDDLATLNNLAVTTWEAAFRTLGKEPPPLVWRKRWGVSQEPENWHAGRVNGVTRLQIH